MKLGMPVIVLQVSRMNDPPQPWSLQCKGPFISARGGPLKIHDSQRGGASTNLHIKGGGRLPDFLFLFYFQTNTFSALGTNGTWFARLLNANSS